MSPRRPGDLHQLAERIRREHANPTPDEAEDAAMGQAVADIFDAADDPAVAIYDQPGKLIAAVDHLADLVAALYDKADAEDAADQEATADPVTGDPWLGGDGHTFPHPADADVPGCRCQQATTDQEGTTQP